MNKDIIKGKWHEIKGKVKQQWGDLTDDEVTKIDGSYEEFEGILQKKYGFNDKNIVKLNITKVLVKKG